MKCGYCGKRFPTTQLDRDMFRNEAWGTPYHYAKNEFGNDDYVSEAGFNPDDEENFLCPDCVDKIYEVQKQHAEESLERDEDGHVVIRLHSSKHLFSSLLLSTYQDVQKYLSTSWNKLEKPVKAELGRILKLIQDVQVVNPKSINLNNSTNDSLVIKFNDYDFQIVIQIYPDQLIYSVGGWKGLSPDSNDAREKLFQLLRSLSKINI